MSVLPPFDPGSVISVILGGGEGNRLYPLTKDRAKPAVPIACQYKLVDIPISLSINAGIKRIFLLTQYMSLSLHSHVQQAYQFDNYAPHGFVEILSAQKHSSQEHHHWYEGTADAVRHHLSRFSYHRHEYVLILSGDQIYRMDYRQLMVHHMLSGADVTVCTLPVKRSSIHKYGIVKTSPDLRVTDFKEKPSNDTPLEDFKIHHHMMEPIGCGSNEDMFLGSMGIYVFNRKTLENALIDGSCADFGGDVLPQQIQQAKVYAYVFRGYWEDVGTIEAYYNASINLTQPNPAFSFHHPNLPIYTRPRHLPPSKIYQSQLHQTVISDGCLVENSKLDTCSLGLRTHIYSGSEIKKSILLGADHFETEAEKKYNNEIQRPHMGVGENCIIERALIDKNVRIGKGVRITNKQNHPDMDHPLYCIRDGITIIPQDGIIPDGMVI